MSNQSKVTHSEIFYDRYCCGWADSWRLRSAHRICLCQEWFGIRIQLRKHQLTSAAKLGIMQRRVMTKEAKTLPDVFASLWEAWVVVWCHFYECFRGWCEPSSDFIASADMAISEWKFPFNYCGGVYRSQILSYLTHFPKSTTLSHQLVCSKTSLLLGLPSAWKCIKNSAWCIQGCWLLES